VDYISVYKTRTARPSTVTCVQFKEQVYQHIRDNRRTSTYVITSETTSVTERCYARMV